MTNQNTEILSSMFYPFWVFMLEKIGGGSLKIALEQPKWKICQIGTFNPSLISGTRDAVQTPRKWSGTELVYHKATAPYLIPS